VWLAFNGIEGFALESAGTDTARKTGYVEDAVHGRTTRTFANDLQSAISAHSKEFGIGSIIHRLNEEIRKRVDLLLLDGSRGASATALCRLRLESGGRSAKRSGCVSGTAATATAVGWVRRRRVVRRPSEARHAAGGTVK